MKYLIESSNYSIYYKIKQFALCINISRYVNKIKYIDK